MLRLCWHLIVPLGLMTALTPISAQPAFPVGKPFPPDEKTLKEIESKAEELKKAIRELPPNTPRDAMADVLVYAKALEWMLRHEEWMAKDTARQTLIVANAGLERAKALAKGEAPWRKVRGQPVIRGYFSRIDGSVQPYAVTVPVGFGQKEKLWRHDVLLHGRDGTLSEVKFIAARETAKANPNPPNYVLIEPYGRGNNAFRWAGERDVFEAAQNFARGEQPNRRTPPPFDDKRSVLRGFSMGGAGTWHIGLHHPFLFTVIGPGAGFTTTHGYIGNLPAELPEPQESTLRIYDAVRYAENAYNVPVVAYSGELDKQKAAADNIEAVVKELGIDKRFTHLIAPGLEHKLPPEWQVKAQAEYDRYLNKGKQFPNSIRFVTYTTRYNDFGWGFIQALDKQYERSLMQGEWTDSELSLKTENVAAFLLIAEDKPFPAKVTIDGQTLPKDQTAGKDNLLLAKQDGKWALVGSDALEGLRKQNRGTPLQGPIDDAFMSPFVLVKPESADNNSAVESHAVASMNRFANEWDKFQRGQLVQLKPEEELLNTNQNLILFGTPQSNPLIAKVVEKLPITWTSDKLVVNGKEYDPKTHLPALIYPNPFNPNRYVVLNSGHTFRAKDFQGTNALLYPRLGDWAVLKPTPTRQDAAAAEVISAGLFDEFWQFPK